jgi:hypothetical protein
MGLPPRFDRPMVPPLRVAAAMGFGWFEGVLLERAGCGCQASVTPYDCRSGSSRWVVAQ